MDKLLNIIFLIVSTLTFIVIYLVNKVNNLEKNNLKNIENFSNYSIKENKYCSPGSGTKTSNIGIINMPAQSCRMPVVVDEILRLRKINLM